jgi:hypothetical protein
MDASLYSFANGSTKTWTVYLDSSRARCGVFAGGGVKHAGRAIGATDVQAAKITQFDWHKNQPIFPEDVTATIYSVLGVDWTKSLSGTPSGRDFVYVESMSGTNFIGSTEVSELFI